MSLTAEQLERCARVRAARGYANLKQVDLAREAGVSYDVIKRIETDARPVVLEELRAIGDACGIPRWFMEHGWKPPAGAATPLEDRLAELEEIVKRLNSGNQAALAEIATQAARATAEALARGELPTAGGGPASTTPGGEGEGPS